MIDPLRFRSDGTFTIVQFTDVHWHDGGEEDQRSRALMDAVLDAESPDLVVYTGDLLGGHKVPDPIGALEACVESAEQRGVPWCAVFGNHDDEASATRDDLMTAMVDGSFHHCRSAPGPDDVPGVGNYLHSVASADGSVPDALHLWFIDSLAYAWTAIGGYAWVRPEQIAWYRREARERRRDDGNLPPALAFFHIPLPEYDEMWRGGHCIGARHEDVCAPRVNSGLFAAFHEVGDVMGVFVGHDHINDFEGDHWGVRLCYGRATGYNTYGRDDFQRGARVIRAREGRRRFDSWLRLADGSIEERVLT